MSLAGRSLGISIAFAFALIFTACGVDGVFSDSPGGDDDGGDDGDGGGDGDGGDGAAPIIDVCGSGGADHATIGEAIAAAPAGAVLLVCPGTYPERLSIVDKPLTIRGTGGAEATILDARGGVALAVEDTTSTGLRVEGLTIRGGDTPGFGGGVRCVGSVLVLVDDVVRENRGRGGGGGLFANGCALTVVGTAFVENDGGERGGGAYLWETSGEVSDSTFQRNRAVSGAGVHVREGSVALRGNQMRDNVAELRGGALYHDSDALVEDNVMVGNSAGWTGGGVHIVQHAPVLRGNLVQGNTADNDGGGIYAHQSRAEILDGRVLDNESGDDGGGIRLFECAAHVEGNLISGNVTADGGGGIRVSHVASQIIDNVIRDNQASFGGGIDMDNDSSLVRGGVIEDNTAWRGGGISATLFPWLGGTLDGVRIAGNTAGYGGGVYLTDNFYPIAIVGLEVVDNVSTEGGGGLFVRATDVTIRNSLIARNRGGAEGGGLQVAQPEPWPDPCPCPPTSPSVDVDFVVLHANQADAGAHVWVDTAGLSIGSSILSGHSGMAVVVLGPEPDWRYNDTVPADFAGMANPTGSSGNMSANPQYVDVDRFALGAGSPCVKAGDPAFTDQNGTRADMGRYGGPEAP